MEKNLFDNKNIPITRREGYTTAERYLKKLCDHSFLSLWTYSSLFRNQGRTGQIGDGKEICDLLVVFQEHIIIFSDKDCEFPDTGNLKLDWNRWFKRAIHNSAKQIWGAERWIKQYPERLFLDAACTQPFPIEIPDLAKAKFHRIIVAHGVAKRCKQVLGGSGSLMIVPSTIGNMHYIDVNNDDQSDSSERLPFVIGQIDHSKGYIHIFEDAIINILMSTLDTITDFITYLDKKELFIQSNKLVCAAGEEDLLAFYLQNVDESGKHDFIVPSYDKVGIAEGLWDEFSNSYEYKVEKELNAVSYSWDKMIEHFSADILNGTQYIAYSALPQAGKFASAEKCMRILAKEPRARRRFLALAFGDFLKKAPSSIPLTRVVEPTEKGYPYYVFLLFPRLGDISAEEYREARLHYLYAYCMVTKLMYPAALDIVGIATESEFGDYIPHSEDAICVSGQDWTEEHYAEARRFQQKYKFYANITKTKLFERGEPIMTSASRMKGRDRNKLCPCGSGKKYKKCCGR